MGPSPQKHKYMWVYIYNYLSIYIYYWLIESRHWRSVWWNSTEEVHHETCMHDTDCSGFPLVRFTSFMMHEPHLVKTHTKDSSKRVLQLNFQKIWRHASWTALKKCTMHSNNCAEEARCGWSSSRIRPAQQQSQLPVWQTQDNWSKCPQKVASLLCFNVTWNKWVIDYSGLVSCHGRWVVR